MVVTTTRKKCQKKGTSFSLHLWILHGRSLTSSEVLIKKKLTCDCRVERAFLAWATRLARRPGRRRNSRTNWSHHTCHLPHPSPPSPPSCPGRRSRPRETCNRPFRRPASTFCRSSSPCPVPRRTGLSLLGRRRRKRKFYAWTRTRSSFRARQAFPPLFPTCPPRRGNIFRQSCAWRRCRCRPAQKFPPWREPLSSRFCGSSSARGTLWSWAHGHGWPTSLARPTPLACRREQARGTTPGRSVWPPLSGWKSRGSATRRFFQKGLSPCGFSIDALLP